MSLGESPVADTVFSVIADTLRVPREELTEQTLIREELEADSMDVVTLMVSLDDAFDTEFDIDDVPTEGVTIGWVIKHISEKLA